MKLPVNYQEVERTYQHILINNLSCLAVSSAQPGEGVSLLVDALAERASSVGKKVLVVDFNLFHPRLDADHGGWHEGQPPKPHALIANQVLCLPAPLDSASRLKLKEPGVLEQLTKQWTDSFDLVLFDCAACQLNNQSNLPPVRIMAAADGVVLCYLAGVTASCQLQSCCQQLIEDGINITGIVINDCFNPPLKLELIRNLQKFHKVCPTLVTWLVKKVLNTQLLSLSL